MAKSDFQPSDRHEITLNLAPGPQHTPGQHRVVEECMSGIARHAGWCTHNMVIELAPERARRPEAAVKGVKPKELREMTEAESFMPIEASGVVDKNGW